VASFPHCPSHLSSYHSQFTPHATSTFTKEQLKAKRSSQGIRNLQSAVRSAVRVTGKATGKAAVGLARWATTDHAGIGKSLDNVHLLGFRNTIKTILVKFILTIAGYVLTFIWIMFLIFLL
jgi:hypothetical protein